MVPDLSSVAVDAQHAVESMPSSRIIRICYEWNGDGHPSLVERALETVSASGGNVKFDLKAYTPSLHVALTGFDNRRVLENFEMVYRKFYEGRRGLPVLAATTLLVPEYVDTEEVGK